jgi:hypothetical protein
MKTVEIKAGNTVADTPMPAAVFLALTASGAKGRLYIQSSKFVLSLSPATDSCSWAFASDSAAGSPFDTLTFRYTRQLQFISNACGYDYFYQLASVQTTHHIIDSVFIANTSVTNDVNTNHLQVYIHPHP